MVIENGVSFPPEKTISSIRLGPLAKWCAGNANSPAKIIHRIHAIIRHKAYFGCRAYHDGRILQEGFETISPNIPLYRCPDINDKETVDWIIRFDPDLVFVFGTRLIGEHVFGAINAPFVNMHWGWSPDYRAEGVVSALAKGGTRHLGVTIHLLDSTIDGGDILYRERPQVDELDNFYSIGLKLVKIGTELFVRVFQDLRKTGALWGTKQDLSQGKLYSGGYMRHHPEMYYRAWKNLRKEHKTHEP